MHPVLAELAQSRLDQLRSAERSAEPQ
jgi:hypothetical protein